MAALLAALLVCPNGARPFAYVERVGAYPTQPAPDPDSPVIRALRASRGPVLELPIGRPEWDAHAVYRTIFHGRPLVNGYGSYYPASLPTRQAVAARLPDVAAFVRLRLETRLTTIVVRVRELDARSRQRWQPVLARREWPLGLRLVLEDDGVLVFDVADAVVPQVRLNSAASDRSGGTLP